MSSKRFSSPASIPEANANNLYDNNNNNNTINNNLNTCTVDLGGSGKKFKACIESDYVALPRFEDLLKKLNLFHRLNCPILIEGPMGSGKSTLIEEFHRRHCNSPNMATPIILNMGEQSDAKTLFGAFVINPARPGEFCWKAGVILEALSTGRWLIIEDVDLASPEMVATVKGLLESKLNYYVAPMGRSFPIHENFRLIATRRSDTTNYHSQSSTTAFDRLGRDLWQSLQIQSLSLNELEILLIGRFSQLSPVLVSVILRLFGLVGMTSSESSVSNSLFKFCSRIVNLVGISLISSDEFIGEELRQALLYEAIDCFASSWNCREKRIELAREMSRLLSLPEIQIDALYNNKPSITLNSDRSRLAIGRVVFNSEIQGMSCFRVTENSSSSIALTTLSCQTLEKLAVSVKMNEPVLLVGETGTGKTTTVQHLAQMLQFQPNLRVLNMSQQSEASDLLGGFKPFSAQSLARPLLEEFLSLFGKAFSKSKNGEYLSAIQEAFAKKSWKRFVKLVKQAIDLISTKITSITPPISHVLLDRLRGSVERFEGQVAYAANNLLFSFVEGSLVEALIEGHWLLLDEINLASPETLNILAGLLRSPSASVTLTERGDSAPIPRHPNFRLFACMNPATDVSKRDLPPAIRSRFTTIFVDETDVRRDDLRQVIDHLIGPGRDGTLKERLTALYYRLKDLVQSFELVDGNGRRPLLNLRTLTRPIKFARVCENIYGLERALYEGWCLSFTTMLDEASSKITRNILREFLMPSLQDSQVPSLRPFTSAIPSFTGDKEHILVEGHILLTGPNFDPSKNLSVSTFVLTPSVQRNVAMLARAVMARNYPILLEGPTSAGKTSVIEYLANLTGHHFVRINNHEHTDIQEYLGTYVSDPETGRLVFKEGILVQALRNGHWLVLDELNLAPSDILEALNRLLDDNREIFLPETGETVRPHPDFQLFATQNPAGTVYGGRKALSRAFRSRFLELQFNDLPLDEIEQILSSRCQIAPSFARRIAQVYRILQERRSTSGSNLFAGKHALITLRDCFRWAERHSHSAVGSTKELAQDGYFVLAERCRHPEETQFIRLTLEKICKTELDSEYEMYDLHTLCTQRGWTEDLARLEIVESLARDLKITWTKPIRRLFTLVYLCVRFREPVILVGETGCGKTTVCQLLAKILQRTLRIVNCHANSESGDFLGSFRPVRNSSNEESSDDEKKLKLFQWTDGPLVEAMQQGDLFLMDEISLADDSVLERLNSVLEPCRYLLLAECTENDEARVISASQNFSILATMNPGGDFGKKELSPALRNRFTEIWVPTIGDCDDLQLIVSANLTSCVSKCGNLNFVQIITDFWYWWQETLMVAGSGASILSASKRSAVSLRDLLGWLQFSNTPSLILTVPKFEIRLLHGAAMIFTDRLGNENVSLRQKTLEYLADALKLSIEDRLQVIEAELNSQVLLKDQEFSIGSFSLPIFSSTKGPQDSESFAFEAPTTRVSALRVLRALQLGKAVLLEGSPGVGKTTLIGALASATSNRLTRINLSEQTDLVDLFGSDLPVDGGVAGRFRWADGPFLQALKRGDWILLDELNLASQSVLEGLNACLDHRGRVFIPELGKEFECSPNTRIFAAQNPAGQGGGRKGLPKSFLNRFTVVWFDSLVSVDYRVILSVSVGLDDPLTPGDIDKMIQFNETLNEQIFTFSSNGRPWEFNLRDLSRWIRLIQATQPNEFKSPVQFIRPLYASRFRTEEDRKLVAGIVSKVYGPELTNLYFNQLPTYDVISNSNNVKVFKFANKYFPCEGPDRLLFLREQLEALEASLIALQMGWLCILTGPGASGKSSLIESLAHLHSKDLRRFFVSPDTDTLELLGSFEQVDYQRRWNLILEEVQFNSSMALDLDSLSNFSSLTESQISDEILNNCPETLKSRVLDFLKLSRSQSAEGRFEWVDGPLVRAMTLGHWLVLENVNLASSAVLDRLNSLFEPNGNLVLSEQGCTSEDGVRIICPTAGFRLFMTVDPKFGEISRAMRNRGLEIACLARIETRVLDDLQVIRQEINDDRLVPLLKRLLPLKLSRRLLLRIAHAAAILLEASVDEILNLFLQQQQQRQQTTEISSSEFGLLSSQDDYWIEKGLTMPFIISNASSSIPSHLQSSMLNDINSENKLSVQSVAFFSLFLIHWATPETLSDRIKAISEFFSIERIDSQISLLIQIIKEYFSLSENDLKLLEGLETESNDNPNLLGYLIWMCSQAQNNSNLRAFQPHQAILKRFTCQSISVNSELLVDWTSKWRHYGFKEEACAQIYLNLRSVLCSEVVLDHSEALQIELLEALETVLSASKIQPELLNELNRFSDILIQAPAVLNSSLSKAFLATPLTLMYLNKIGGNVLKRIQNVVPSASLSIPRRTLAQEWLTQVWTLTNSDPLNFFCGFDGLGCLLETANRAWATRTAQDESELIKVFDDVLKFVVKHGGKDKKLERLFLLKNLFDSSVSSNSFADILISQSLEFLNGSSLEFDPVIDHFQVAQRSLSTAIDFYTAKDHWERLFQAAYVGSTFLLKDHSQDIYKLSIQSQAIEDFIIVRPQEGHTEIFRELGHLCTVRMSPLLAQVKEVLNVINNNNNSVQPVQIETLQLSLLRIRMELLQPRFVFYRDLTASFIDAIDRLKAGLYLKQIERNQEITCKSLMLPLNFGINEKLFDGCESKNQNLVVDSVTLHLARYVPKTDSKLIESVLSVLSRTLEHAHESIKSEALRNQKNDSLFVFKGSNNDDDALDSELATELFGDFERKSKIYDFDDSDMQVDEVNVEALKIYEKKINYANLSSDLLIICMGIATDSKCLTEVSEILSRSFEFISNSVSLVNFSDSQVYRMLIWTLSEKLVKRRQIIKGTSRTQSVHYDFYRDACPEGRIQDALKVLNSFQNRLKELLEEWPEHDVLQSLERQIERFYKLPVASTSMIEALLALEKLYLRSQDWEKYSAAKQTSLGQCIPDLLHLIVDWRRAEVQNWKGLLDAVVMKMENESIVKNGEWLSIARVALSRVSDGPESTLTIIEIIDTFMLAAPVGQFTKRLQILEFCTKLALQNSENYNNNNTMNTTTTASAFNAALLYYQTTLAHRVREYIRMCREPVERDLSAFLMTLYWKDINYWSVRQTSEKSHRHLARMIRKWKESMQMPLSALLNQLTIKAQLQPASMENPEIIKNKNKKNSSKSSTTLSSKTQFNTITSLGLKVKSRLDALNYSALSSEIIESFGNSILVTLNELKESTETSIQSKQKAFVDLIRELKVLGIRINRNPSSDLLAAKSILCSYAQASRLNCPRDPKSEYYLIRTLEKWQKLSSTVAHDDITFRQAEIIKNSMAYLIETLITGTAREIRDVLAEESFEIQGMLDTILYRQSISGGSICCTENSLNIFNSSLWNSQVQLTQLSVMFESHKSQNVQINWSLLIEIFSLTKSSFTEISSLLQQVKQFKGFSIVIPVTVYERISLLLASVVQSVLVDFDFSSEASQQVSDLTVDFKFILKSVADAWSEVCKSSQVNHLEDLNGIQSDVLIRKLLLAVQVCETEIPLPSLESLDEFSIYPDYLRKHAESSDKIINNFKVNIKSALSAVLSYKCCPLELVEVSVVSAKKLLTWIDSLVLDHYRNLARLTLILSNVFLHLYQEGFCRPPPVENDSKKEEDSKEGKLSEGMGIGEGEGEKNVSKEIEFEEQVTGTLDEKDEQKLEKEEKSDDKKDDKDEDKIDMNQDFDGALEDLMEEEENDEEENNEKEEDEEIPQDQMKEDEEDKNEKNKNEEIQDLDPSWWNSENENEDEEEEKGLDDDNNDKKIPDNQQKDDKKKEKKEKKLDNENEEEPLAASNNNEDSESETSGTGSGIESENEKEPVDNETKSNDEDSKDVDMEKMNSDLEPESEVEFEEEEKQQPEQESEEQEQEQDQDQEMENDIKSEEINEEDEELEVENEKADDDLTKNQMEDIETISNENINEKTDNETETETKDEDEDDQKLNDSENAANNDQIGNDNLQQQDTEMDNSAESANSSNQQLETSGSEKQVKTFDTQGRSSNNSDLSEDSKANEGPQPLTEQVEKWKRTIHRILNNETKNSLNEQTEQLNDTENLTKEQQYEHAQDPEDKNALTVKAEAEESLQINGEDDTSASNDKASLEAETKEVTAVDDDDDDDDDDDNEGNSSETDKEEKLKLVPHLKKSNAGKDEDSVTLLSNDLELEEHLRQLSILPGWSEYEQGTSDLAFDLCEQLRLILVPTQATKLRGDYRTGKRLNLRKILPYIASQYRRDKIWLRRTKPSQRNYRVCLSIDNSKSMMETGSVGLAFQAIATISQALERLEVGELALIGFGEEARVLQEFSSGVAKVSVGEQLRTDLLKFDESSTDMTVLLQTVLDTFASAAATPTINSGPVWQLNIILSDGICHHHDQIKPLLAHCHSARILNIFVLLDNRPIESSIFELSHVEYVDQGIDPMTGQVKTGIKMTKYLETFPFEFYVVLRDVQMLPGVLAESLKQWFEMISLQEGEH